MRHIFKIIDELNNTLSAKQKQLLAEMLDVGIPVTLLDSYVLLKDIKASYKQKLYSQY